MAFATVLAVGHNSHKDTGTAPFSWAFASQTLDFAVTINLVVLKDSEFGLLALVLDLLWGGVNLLLALLTTTTKAEDEMKGALLLDVVVRKGATVLKLLPSEDQTLLIWGNSFLILDLALDIVDGVRRLNLKGDSFTREGLNENLHCCLKKMQVRLYNLQYFDILREGKPINHSSAIIASVRYRN